MAQPLIQKNIVIIAETGAGKSSLLNNVALILRYVNFEEATYGARDFVPPIPVRTWLKNVLIVDGQDDNERSDQASSRTLRPQIYRIREENVELNIMDTPGMSDSGGRKLDEEHVQNITACFGQLKDIHGILVLLKSTENTVNDSLKYTLNMVLSCLGKTAGKMISFGITFCNYNKNPGTAPDVIRKFSKGLRHSPGIDYSNDNMYCFESMPLFYVLYTKKGFAVNTQDQQVNTWAYESNVDELHKFLYMVFKRNDSYQVLNIPALILAKKIQPALASLLPHLDTKEEEIKSDLDKLEKEWLSKNLEYAQQQSNLKQIRQWIDKREVTKTRIVNKSPLETKQRIVDEKYTEKYFDWQQNVIGGKNGADAAFAGALAGAGVGFATGGPVAAVLGFIGGFFRGMSSGSKPDEIEWVQVEKERVNIRPKLEEYSEKTVPVFEEYQDTEDVERVDVEEDPLVKDLLVKIENERRKIESNQSQNSSLYQKFQAEKKMVSSLLCDLTSFLEEHAIVAFGDSGLGSSASSEIGKCIHNLKTSGQWFPTSTNIGAAQLIARLTAMQSSQHFGNVIKNILSQCQNLEHAQPRVVDIAVPPKSAFIESLIQVM